MDYRELPPPPGQSHTPPLSQEESIPQALKRLNRIWWFKLLVPGLLVLVFILAVIVPGIRANRQQERELCLYVREITRGYNPDC